MKRLREVEDLTRKIYDGLRHGDVDTITETISREDGLVWVGTDPKEWWTSHETMVRVFRDQLKAIGSFDLVDTDPHGYGEGDVGWVADQPALRLAAGADIPLRVTALAHREAGAWRFVQWHVSIGVSNEKAVGEEVPPCGHDARLGSNPAT
jgi:hypothetical protein